MSESVERTIIILTIVCVMKKTMIFAFCVLLLLLRIERLRFRAHLIFVSKKIFLTKRARSRTDARFAGTRISTPRVRTYSETCDDDTTKAPRSSRSRDTHVQSIEDCQARREAESYFFATRKYDSTFSFFREERREDRDDDGRKRNVHKRRERNLSIDLAFEDDRGNRGVDR